MSLSRLLLKHVLEKNKSGGIGCIDVLMARKEYVKFMTTPGSHNDTYCGTCHRMFFSILMDGKALDKCPDNDHHNVDTIDALAGLTPVILASYLGKNSDMKT